MGKTATDIFHSKAKVQIDFKGNTIKDALNFGFSFIESEDHVVEYVVANNVVTKKIFAQISDSKVDMEDGAIGSLWTAKLLLFNKLSDNQILFSNNTFSAVINLNLNSDEDKCPGFIR
jgi:hypothetical protein